MGGGGEKRRGGRARKWRGRGKEEGEEERKRGDYIVVRVHGREGGVEGEKVEKAKQKREKASKDI